MPRQRGVGQRRSCYGRGHWPRAQLFAIVQQYRIKGRDPQWVARRLGVGHRLVVQIYEYLDWCDDLIADDGLEDVGDA